MSLIQQWIKLRCRDRRPVGRMSPSMHLPESVKGLMMYNKATNTCNPAVTGFCLFPKNDSLRIQLPLIAQRRPGDISSLLGGRWKAAVPAGLRNKKTSKVFKLSFKSLHPICGDVYDQFCIPKWQINHYFFHYSYFCFFMSCSVPLDVAHFRSL